MGFKEQSCPELNVVRTLHYKSIVTKKIYVTFWQLLERFCRFNHVFQLAPELKNKCSRRSMEVQLPILLGNYDRPTDQQTVRQGHREFTLPISIL